VEEHPGECFIVKQEAAAVRNQSSQRLISTISGYTPSPRQSDKKVSIAISQKSALHRTGRCEKQGESNKKLASDRSGHKLRSKF
jgi:hypothetical protein